MQKQKPRKLPKGLQALYQYCFKMSNARVQQIVSLLYMHKYLVTSEGVKTNTIHKLKEFLVRLDKHNEYYLKNDLIRTNFDFLKK